MGEIDVSHLLFEWSALFQALVAHYVYATSPKYVGKTTSQPAIMAANILCGHGHALRSYPGPDPTLKRGPVELSLVSKITRNNSGIANSFQWGEWGLGQ